MGVEAATAARGGLVAELLRAARPLQWTKNSLLFAGIIFAVEFGDLGRWLHAIAIFAAYCAGSSAAYLVNDLRDRELDAAHPVKRFRPLAAGTVSPIAAVLTAVVLFVLACGLALVVGPWSLAILIGFMALHLTYTAGLKNVVLLDVLVIAGLFVIRAAAGAVAVDVRLSPWLVVCTGLLALFLALAKRRGELLWLPAEAPSRPVLTGYSLELVDQLLAIVAAATISAYSLYTFTATSSEAMMLTIPFVVFAIFRYLYLVHRRHLGEEPEHILVRDVPTLLTIFLWTICAVVILLLTG